MSLTLRRAGVDDYEDVLDINRDIYSGLDYLPAMYKTYINSHNRIMMVAILQDKIVSEQII